MSMQTVARVKKIADPVKRVAAAARLTDEAGWEADKARTRRDLAAVTLRRVHNWRQVDVRNLLGCSRALIVRIEERAPDVIEPEIQDPENVIREAMPVIERYAAIEAAARDIRDAVVSDMLTGEIKRPDGRVYTNAEVARMTGLSTPRIAQIRTGNR
jgi:hypothetical protein